MVLSRCHLFELRVQYFFCVFWLVRTVTLVRVYLHLANAQNKQRQYFFLLSFRFNSIFFSVFTWAIYFTINIIHTARPICHEIMFWMVKSTSIQFDLIWSLLELNIVASNVICCTFGISNGKVLRIQPSIKRFDSIQWHFDSAEK